MGRLEHLFRGKDVLQPETVQSANGPHSVEIFNEASRLLVAMVKNFPLEHYPRTVSGNLPRASVVGLYCLSSLNAHWMIITRSDVPAQQILGCSKDLSYHFFPIFFLDENFKTYLTFYFRALETLFLEH